jgi:hypothetical protein
MAKRKPEPATRITRTITPATEKVKYTYTAGKGTDRRAVRLSQFKGKPSDKQTSKDSTFKIPEYEAQVTKARNRYMESYNYFVNNYKKQYETYWNNYKGVRKKGTNVAQWRTNGFIPLVFAQVQTELPRFMNGLVGPDGTNFFSVQAEKHKDSSGNDLDMSADVIQDIQAIHMQKFNFWDRLYMGGQTAMIFGTGWILQTWESSEVTHSYDMVSSTEAHKKEPITVKKDNPKWTYKTPFDVWPDPNASSWDDMGYVVVRTFVTPDMMETMHDDKMFNNEEKYQFVMTAFNNEWTIDDNQSSEKIYELFTVYTKEDVTQFFLGEAIDYRENPFCHRHIPLYTIKRYPDFYNFNGVGVAQILNDIQGGINDMYNLVMDNTKLTVNKIFIKRKGSPMEQQSMLLEPGKVIPLENPEDLRPLDIGNVDLGGFKMMDSLMSMMNIATGSSDILNSTAGTNAAQHTATGMNILTQEANSRYAMAIKWNKECFLIPMLNDLLLLYRQYLDKTAVTEILGEERAAKYNVDSIEDVVRWDGEYSYIINGDISMQDKQVVLSNLETGIPMLKELGANLDTEILSQKIILALNLDPKIIKRNEQPAPQPAPQQAPQQAPQPAPSQGALEQLSATLNVPINLLEQKLMKDNISVAELMQIAKTAQQAGQTGQPSQNAGPTVDPSKLPAVPKEFAKTLTQIGTVMHIDPKVLYYDIQRGSVTLPKLVEMAKKTMASQPQPTQPQPTQPQPQPTQPQPTQQ